MKKNNSLGNNLTEKVPIKHFLLIMRTIFILLFACIFCSMAEVGYTQNARVTINKRNVTLKEVLNEIESQTDYLFIYSNEVNTDEKVSVKSKQQAVANVLSALLKGKDVDYSMEGNHIILSAIEKTSQPEKGTTVDIAQQQKKAITGTVVDVAGVPVIGANIVEAGTTNGTVTDVDGNFSLQIENNATIRVSYIGYLEQEISTTGKISFHVTLLEDTQALDELVVVGYGVQKRRQLTSAVSTIKEKEFNQGSVSDVYDVIKGKIPGLNISRGTYGGSTVLLRGVSSINGDQSPLIVIDGVIGASTANLDPNDIESVDVLKDGSAAAIYGTRGTNGVIIITTKRNKEGSSKINISSYISLNTIYKIPEVLNRNEYLTLNPSNAIDYGYETDWISETLDNKAPITHHHNISVSGGTPKTNYRFSINANSSETFIRGKDNNGIGARFNFEHNLMNNKMSILGNMYTRITNSSSLDYRNMEKALRMNPTAPIMDPDTPLEYFEPGGDEYNPIAIYKQMHDQSKTMRIGGDISISYNIINGLKANFLYALRPRFSITQEYDEIKSYHSMKKSWNGRAAQKFSYSMNHLLDLTLNYLYEKNKNSIDIVTGYSYDNSILESASAENFGFLSDGFKWNNLSQGSWLKDGKANMDSNKSMNRLIALFGRINYSFDDKYLMSMSIRHEGSSKFGINNKWGFFPAISTGWRLSSEPFLNNINWIDDLKLRIGYGVTGNEGFSPYKSTPTITAIKDGMFYNDETGNWILTYGPGSNANPNLRWEKKHELNLGLDFSFFKERLTGNVDVYMRKTKDLLYNNAAPTPPMLYPTIFSNIGEMTNKGIEVGLHGLMMRKSNFEWNTSIIFSYFDNKLNKLFNELSTMHYLDLESLSGVGYAFRLEEGRGVSQFYGYRYAGLTEDGRWLLYNKNNEKVTREEVVQEDKAYLGNGLPKMNIGFSNSFSYKNWSLSFFMRGDFLFKILNDKEIQYANKFAYPFNVLKSTLDKHSQLNDAKIYSDYYLEKGDYIKLDNLNLSYNLRPKNKYINSVNISAIAENLFCITNYSGIDPEISGDPLAWGLDKKRFFPSTRGYTLKIELNF